MPVVWNPDGTPITGYDSPLLTCLLGLYYKLHGVHRPVTMKKSVIKRRKRVIPASQGMETDDAMTIDSTDQQSQYAESDMERGSINDDGSINLGLRRPTEPLSTLLPEPVRSAQGGTSLQPTDLTAYHTSHLPQAMDLRESLTDDNRLAPLTSLSVINDRQSSISPASFLSPTRSRKRSFSAADPEFPSHEPNPDNTKRLSSIKSILNPAAESSPGSSVADTTSEPSHFRRSPTFTTVSSSHSPSRHPGPSNTLPSMFGREPAPPDSERAKADRRAALQEEAARMREMLAAKERELASLE